MEIRQLPANEYDKALDLSLDVFIECGRKDFDEEGLETFKNFIYNKQLVNELTFYGAFDGESLIGVIATKNEGKHISLFFIKPSYHRRGIGKQLFEPVCEEQVTHGMKYTPMKRMGTKVRELEKVC